MKLQQQRNDIIHNKLGREQVTRDMVLEVNALTCDFVYKIWNNVNIPEVLPDCSIIPPVEKRRRKRKRK